MTAAAEHLTKQYNPDEVETMGEAGYITPRQAALMYAVNLSVAYRATRPREVRGKTVRPAVRVRLGANGRARYLCREDWVRVMDAKRQATAKSLGLVLRAR
jgi:hypothetical protein